MVMAHVGIRAQKGNGGFEVNWNSSAVSAKI